MKLNFNLLVIDDNPDSIVQAVAALRDHLDSQGFTLVDEYPSKVSPSSIRHLAWSRGRNFDLVAVDYLLASNDFDGGDMASIIRRELAYTDMVFYSSNASLDLLGRLAQSKVEGVFVATRDELGEALSGVADTIIGKAVDLNHMRGIAMAEVAEMDLLMEDTLADAFNAGDSALDAVATRTANRIKNSMTESAKRVDEVVSKQRIVGLVRDPRLVSSAQKFHALRRVCKAMNPKPYLGVLDSYQSEVIDKRNLLAHAKEVDDGNGTSTLQSSRGGSTITIDDEWMAEFRRTLLDQRSALESICSTIRSHFS